MRKSVLLYLILLVLSVSAQPVSEQEALQKARNFLKGKNFVNNAQLTRSVTANPYKHLYIFNAEDNGGFVIVSGDSRAREILAYSEEGHIDFDQMPDNMKWWIGLYDKSIASISAADMPTAQASAPRRASKADVTPMMSYSWKQGSPYNSYCPSNCLAGCVPLSIAQMLAFHRYPATLPALNGYKDNNGNNLEALSSRGVDYSNLNADDAAWLVRYAGQAIRANYGQSATIALGGYIPGVLANTFGYGKGVHNEYRQAYNANDWDDLLYKELSEGRPFILSGQVNYDINNGHTFICHGYSQGYYAVNWGWGGTCNGYFAMSAMIGNGVDYSTDLAACIGISTSTVTNNCADFSMNKMVVASGTQLSRTSSSYGFNNVRFAWKLRNSYMTAASYELALAINKPDNSWDLLCTFTANTYDPTQSPYAETVVNIGSKYGDGTYRITMLYKKPDESNWHPCQGLTWRYVEAVISGNTITFTNYPQYDPPYQTGTYPDYPYNPGNPDDPDDPVISGPTEDVLFDYTMGELKKKEGRGVGFIVDWTALSTAMYSHLNMNETQFFDNFWVDCFSDDYEVPEADARYVSPYAYNYNHDGSQGVNNYDMLIFNFGDDIFGNHGKLPTGEDALYAEPESDYIAISSYYPYLENYGKHIIYFEIPAKNLETLCEGQNSPITFTRWLRFAAKTNDVGYSTAPFRYLWLKVSMQIAWDGSGSNGITTVDADKSAPVYYNLRGQRLTSPQKGINIINGKKVLIR